MKRSYLDPIHQDITLDRSDPAEALIIDLIDSQEFQRLRRIHQLGVVSFTFHGAEGSRFTHSVGVMHVANRLFSALCQEKPHLKELKVLVLASALLHDVGHGPFSHDSEKILGLDHEEWSCRIISGKTEVNQVLGQYKLLERLPDQIISVLEKNYRPKFISQLISSQLDCDRFDYLLRDSYMTGTAYGLFALQRVISALEVDEEAERMIVVGEKGQAAVEDYLFARYSMYSQVYYHKKNLAARTLLSSLIKRAKHMIEAGSKDLFIDEPTRKWLVGAELSVDEYLSLDDMQLVYHIKRWSQSQDNILADLAYRFLNRHLFKTVRLIDEGAHKQKELEAIARKLTSEHKLDPEYYVSVESTGFRPYDYYRPESGNSQANIMVRTEMGEIKELSQLSLTIEALVRGNYESRWLVYPPEIDDALKSLQGNVPTGARLAGR
jgi:HD superfamily phosphohydrolase